MSEEIRHKGVSAVVRNSETGKYLLLKRSGAKDYPPGIWEFPGGGLEDETPVEGVKRELREETGLDLEPVRKAEPFTWRSEHGKLKTYAFLFETDREQVEIGREHQEYRWVSLDEMEDFETFRGNSKDLEALVICEE